MKKSSQLKAILIRRFRVLIRSKAQMIWTFSITIISSIITVILTFVNGNPTLLEGYPMDFNYYIASPNSFIRLEDSSNISFFPEIDELYSSKASEAAGGNFHVNFFPNFSDIDNYVSQNYQKYIFPTIFFSYSYLNHSYNSVPPCSIIYDPQNLTLSGQISLFYGFNRTTLVNSANDVFADYYLSPSLEEQLMILYPFLLKKVNKTGGLAFFAKVGYSSRIEESLLIEFSPFVMVLAILILFSFFTGQLVDERRLPIVSFMYSNGLSHFDYWVGNFLMDLITYEILSIIIFILYLIFQANFVKNNIFVILWTYMINGPQLVIFSYIVTYFFSKPTYSLIFIFFFVICIIIVMFIVIQYITYGLSFYYSFLSLISPYSLMYVLFYLFINFDGKITKSLPISTYFSTLQYGPLMYSPLITFFIWSLILYLIERFSLKRKIDVSQSLYYEHRQEFIEYKENLHVTDEAYQMEREVEEGVEDGTFAIKIQHAYRAFQHANGKVFAAVNDVTLGIKPGSLFGFLGANGAGKSTMMNMIQDQLILSAGSIQINGIEVGKTGHGINPEFLSVCPQYNDHLTPKLTIREQLNFFADIQGLDQAESWAQIEHLLDVLNIIDLADTRIEQLSGGNQRKVAVAAAFLGESDIIMLDEPTASLDPVARHLVHNLLNEYKGQKTFMLTTHMLEEAEALCDNLSIMLHGAIYTVGTPQYLASKFGRSWEVELFYDYPSAETEERVNQFMETKFPEAIGTIGRQYSKSYSIPIIEKASTIFNALNEARANRIGIKYFTCSSSSLEKVFLEIVELSEKRNENIIDDDNNQKGFCSCCTSCSCCKKEPIIDDL